ncbi:MAG: hypothetical protein H6Q89_5745, partial [Myxococcaceae bacterium]|nr:hypothetical protein [Myxococcaceae bacterium]
VLPATPIGFYVSGSLGIRLRW